VKHFTGDSWERRFESARGYILIHQIYILVLVYITMVHDVPMFLLVAFIGVYFVIAIFLHSAILWSISKIFKLQNHSIKNALIFSAIFLATANIIVIGLSYALDLSTNFIRLISSLIWALLIPFFLIKELYKLETKKIILVWGAWIILSFVIFFIFHAIFGSGFPLLVYEPLPVNVLFRLPF
jgi:hypothetical protein